MTAFMSKTDKTAPWTVRVFNRPYWLEAHHDHRNGICDLPPRPKPGEVDELYAYRGRCGWVAAHEFWCHRQNACGCPWCNQSAERRAEVRKERHNARQYARGAWRNEY